MTGTNRNRNKEKRRDPGLREDWETFDGYNDQGDRSYGELDARQLDGRGYRPDSSSYGANQPPSNASTPLYDDYSNVLPAGQQSKEPYPAWTADAQIPV